MVGPALRLLASVGVLHTLAFRNSPPFASAVREIGLSREVEEQFGGIEALDALLPKSISETAVRGSVLPQPRRPADNAGLGAAQVVSAANTLAEEVAAVGAEAMDDAREIRAIGANDLATVKAAAGKDRGELRKEVSSAASAAIAGALSAWAAIHQYIGKFAVPVSVIFATVCAILLLKVVVVDLAAPGSLEKRHQVEEQAAASCVLEAAELEGSLVHSAGARNSLVGEECVRKQRALEERLPKLAGPQSLEAIRCHVQLWLRVFQQRYLDVDGGSAADLDCFRSLSECRTVADIVQVVHASRPLPAEAMPPVGPLAPRLGQQMMWECEECPPHAVLLAASARTNRLFPGWIGWTEKAGCGWQVRKEHGIIGPFPVDCQVGFLKITILSWFHGAVLWGIKLGLGLSGITVALSQFAPALLVGAGTLFLLILLCLVERIDGDARHWRDFEVMRQRRLVLEEKRDNLKAIVCKRASLEKLWRHQTLPRLELFEQVGHLLVVTTAQRDKTLEALNQRLERLDAEVGDPSLCFGESAMKDFDLALISEQINACTDFISKHGFVATHGANAEPWPAILQRLDEIFTFLRVRVVACFDLPPRPGDPRGEAADACVTVHTSQGEDSRGQCTETISSSLNPRWHHHGRAGSQEFFFPVVPGDSSFSLQVWDNKGGVETESLGLLTVLFRASASAGTWQRRRETLHNRVAGVVRAESEIEYEFFFGTSAKHLAQR